MSNEFRRILFGIQGGFPTAQEDLEFLQESLLDNIGMLAVSACLGQSSIIFGGAPVHDGITLSIADCRVLLNGTVLPCPAQNIAGGTFEKFWMISESETGTPLQFLDGSVHDTREVRTARIVYADTQPSGSVRVADVKVYAQLLVDSLVTPVTSPLAQTLTGHTQTLAGHTQTLTEHTQDIQSINGKFGDSGWIDLAAGSNISSSNTRYRKFNGVVFVSIGATCTSNLVTTIGTLPAGFRPSTAVGSTLMTIRDDGTSTSYARFEILTTGQIRLNPASQYTPFRITTNITFPAG
jgi:hypothetical protein